MTHRRKRRLLLISHNGRLVGLMEDNSTSAMLCREDFIVEWDSRRRMTRHLLDIAHQSPNSRLQKSPKPTRYTGTTPLPPLTSSSNTTIAVYELNLRSHPTCCTAPFPHSPRSHLLDPFRRHNTILSNSASIIPRSPNP